MTNDARIFRLHVRYQATWCHAPEDKSEFPNLFNEAVFITVVTSNDIHRSKTSEPEILITSLMWPRHPAGLSTDMKPVRSPLRSGTHVCVFILFSMAQQRLVGQGLLIIEASRSHWVRHTTLGRTSLDEWSAWRRHLYLKTHSTHNTQTSMAPAGFFSVPFFFLCSIFYF